MISSSITTTSGTAGGMPDKVKALAEAMARIHGSVHVSREKKGLHLNTACPDCLVQHGDVELNKRHLAINGDKACGTGQWSGSGKLERDRVGMCMKCRKTFRVSKLLAMKPLEQRGFKVSRVGKVSMADNTAWLIEDQQGNLIPGGPGTCTLISQLPRESAGRWYLESRGYNDLVSLENQMRVSWCSQEWAEDAVKGRYYRRIHASLTPKMKDTPQGRLIFFCDMDGVQRGWQARVMESTQDGVRSFLHPYTGQWVPVEHEQSGKPTVLPALLMGTPYSAPSKYRSSNGIERNSVLFGYDAAVRWNQQHRPGREAVVFVTEGPLDACRLGAPAVAQIGQFLSDAQVDWIARRFGAAVLVPDTDEPGQKNKQDSFKRLSRKVKCRVWDLPPGYKDAGSLPAQVAQEAVRNWLTLI